MPRYEAMLTRQERKTRGPLNGWGTVLILVIAYAVSFVDRQIVSLLVEPLRADLGLDDTQIGLLQGPAFGLFYTILGLPLGLLADRTNRVRLIAVGIFLWSVMTMACGLATSFGGLFLARVGVGIGEAALVPAAVSLLADLFQPERRALPMSIFTAGLSLGAGLALVLGGSFVGYAHEGVRNLPLIGAFLADRHPWQTVFMLAGLLGLPVTAAVLSLAEPVRSGIKASSMKSGWGGGYLRAHWRLFVPMLAGAGLLYLFSNAVAAWLPTLFIRRFHWLPAEVGLRLGPIVMVCAVTGNLFGGFITAAMAKRGRFDAPLNTMILGSGLLIPVAILAPLAPDPTIALVGVVLIYLGIALCFGIATAAFITVTPGLLRGRIVALYLLVGNLFGLGLGPLSVGLLLDDVLRDRNKVGLAITIVGAATVAPGFLLLRSVIHTYSVRAADIYAEASGMVRDVIDEPRGRISRARHIADPASRGRMPE
jgi:MFS family permease